MSPERKNAAVGEILRTIANDRSTAALSARFPGPAQQPGASPGMNLIVLAAPDQRPRFRAARGFTCESHPMKSPEKLEKPEKPDAENLLPRCEERSGAMGYAIPTLRRWSLFRAPEESVGDRLGRLTRPGRLTRSRAASPALAKWSLVAGHWSLVAGRWSVISVP
jgi:hypothetical protein